MTKREKIFRFESEAAMCAAYIRDAARLGWDAYPETGGFDIVLVHRKTKWQIGVEAKQQLNSHVICQAAEDLLRDWRGEGPDFRAVLVPNGGDGNLCTLAALSGIQVVRARGEPDRHGWTKADWGRMVAFDPELPDQKYFEAGNAGAWFARNWPQHAPARQIALPDYVPDVIAGASSPVALTEWKIRAIKLCVLLGRRGFLTGADFKHFEVSISRWLQSGWLIRDGKRLVAGELPDFRAQHPRNFVEIEADFEKWSKGVPAPSVELFDQRTPLEAFIGGAA